MMTQEVISPPQPEHDVNSLRGDLQVLARKYRSSQHPGKGELRRCREKPLIYTAITSELHDAAEANDPLRAWDAAMWYQRLDLKIPDPQFQDYITKLLKRCEGYMDTNHLPYKPTNIKQTRRGMIQGGLATAAVAGVGKLAFEVMSSGRQSVNTYIKFDANTIFTAPSSSALSSLPEGEAERPAPPDADAGGGEASEPEPEVVGNVNMAEFFLSDLLNLFKYRRKERVLFEPGVKDRLMPALLEGDQITFLYLGLDETRERKNEFLGNGRGRSDVIMLVSFNPHTFKTIAISLPRDMYTPFLGRNKLNAMTAGVIGGDRMELSRTIVEQLTGVPIDGIIQTNIDTIQGFNGIRNNNYGSEGPGIYYPGIFDVLAPAGLMINVPRQIVDDQYPVGYGTKRLVIPAGAQRMNGQRLTEYARTRHQESDFGRSSNQRDILSALLRVLAEDAKHYLLSGDTGKLDLFISFLEREEQNGNIHYNEVNFTGIVRNIRDGLVRLRDAPSGRAVLIKLALNSADQVAGLIGNPQSVFASYGLSSENGMLVSIEPGSTQLKLKESAADSSPIQYSQPLRKKVKQLFGIS